MNKDQELIVISQLKELRRQQKIYRGLLAPEMERLSLLCSEKKYYPRQFLIR